jgi:hypothetical protein
MTGHKHEPPGYDAADLDGVIVSAMSGILAKLEAGFDPDAGLADIHARCGIPLTGASPDSPGNDRPRPRRSNPDPRRSP